MAVLPLRKHWASLLSFLVVCIQVQSSDALSMEYCSTQNTGGGASPNNSIYQSNGLCHDACISSYAFAIIQGRNCWCSNYAPADQVGSNRCNTPCPGYPTELCGNEAQSLFGYFALNVAPSGTLGASSSTAAVSTTRPSSSFSSPAPFSSSSPMHPLPVDNITASDTCELALSYQSLPASRTSPATSSPPAITLEKTSISEPTEPIQEVATPFSVTLPSSTPSPSTTSVAEVTASISIPRASSHTPTPVTNVQVVTQSGQIFTQTITTTPTVPVSANQEPRKNGIAPGYIAAAVIAGLLGLVFILAGIWLLIRRRKDRDGEKSFQTGSSRDMQRNISVHSKAGLLDGNSIPTINTRYSGQRLLDDGLTSASPSSERRKSQPLIWDQRLNPNALMVNENGSKTSLHTIDDHRDYGRTLQVTNPDIRTSFS